MPGMEKKDGTKAHKNVVQILAELEGINRLTEQSTALTRADEDITASLKDIKDGLKEPLKIAKKLERELKEFSRG